jgi:hypothetical protein
MVLHEASPSRKGTRRFGRRLAILAGFGVVSVALVAVLWRAGWFWKDEPRVFAKVPLPNPPPGVESPQRTDAVQVARNCLGISEGPIPTGEGERVEVRKRSERGNQAVVDIIQWNCADDSVRDLWDRVVIQREADVWKASQHLRAWRGARDRNWGFLSRIPWLQDRLPFRNTWTTNRSE